MARLLGEARVSILPDGTRFKPEAEAAVKKGTAGINAKIPVTLDTEKFKTQAAVLKAQVAELQKKSASIKVDLNDKQGLAQMAYFQAQLDRIAARVATAKTDVDISQAAAQILKLDVQLDKFGAKRVTARASVETGGDAEKIGVLSALLDKIGLKRVTARVNVDTKMGKAALSDLLLTVTGLGKKMEKAGNDGGSHFGKGFAGGLTKSAIFQNPGITALVIAGLAALPAAVGAVAVLGGIALGGGIVAAAVLSINKGLKTASTNLKTATAQLAKDLKAHASAGVIEADKQAVAAAQQQVNLLNREAAAFKPVVDGVNNLKQAFIQFAIVTSKPLIKPFTDALNLLSKQLRGPLAKDFTNLFKAVAPLIKPVEIALLEIVRGILPGMTELLTKARGPLSQMFIEFGKIVGLKVGQWFRDAIPFIKDSGHYLNALIGILGNVGSWLIKFGGATAKAFQGKELKGFGPLIQGIANDLTKIVIPAFEGWMSVIAPVARDLLAIIKPIADFLAKNPGLVKAIAATVAAMMLMNKTMDILIGTTKLLGLSMDALPWVALAAAVVVATIVIIKNWKPISHFFQGIWHDIHDGFVAPLANFFMKTVPHAAGIAVGGIEHAWNTVASTTSHIWGNILKFLKNWWPVLLGSMGGPIGAVVALVVTHWNTVKNVTAQIWGNIFNFLKGIWGHIENAVTGVFKPIATEIDHAWQTVVNVTKQWWGMVWRVIKPIVGIIIGLVGELVIGVRNAFNAVWPWIYNLTKNVWGHIENTITGIVKPIVSFVVGSWHFIQSVTGQVWTWIYNTSKNIWGHIENVITGMVKPLVAFVVNSWHFIQSVTGQIWTWIYNTSKNIWGHIENVITGFVKPLVSFVVGSWHTLQNVTGQVWTWIYNTSKNVWGHIENAVTGIVKPMVSTVIGLWNTLKSNTANAFNWIHDHIIAPLTKAWDWVGNKFVGGIKGAFNGLVTSVKSIWAGLKKAVGDPINFVGDHIWNPFAHFVNTGLSIFGLGGKGKGGLTLPNFSHINFAVGGQVPGYAPGRDIVPAMLSPGEFVMRPEAVKAIGADNLHALNSMGGYPTFANGGVTSNITQFFANGGGTPPHATRGNQNNNPGGPATMLQFAESFNGHPYHWGGPSNPTNGWDCSSFVGYVLGHFGLKLPGGVSWNPNVHGPVAAAYNNTPGWGSVGHDVNSILPGDLLVENTGGHVGFGVGPNRMFSAFNTALGTRFTDASGMTNIYRYGGGISPQAGPLGALGNIVGSVLKAAASAVLSGVEGLANLALGHIPGMGPFHDIPKAAIDKLLEAAKNKITGNSNNYTVQQGGSGTPGGNPGVVPISGGGFESLSNLVAYARYFMSQGLNASAAAGMAGTISGEQNALGPESRGSGGWGLIGWTGNTVGLPPGYHGPTGNVQYDLQQQLKGVIGYMNARGGPGPLNSAGSPVAAGNVWSRYEAPAVPLSDTRPQTANAIYALLTGGGQKAVNTQQNVTGRINFAPHHANGGLITPFANGGLASQIQAKLAQVEQEKNTVASLASIKKPTRAQALSLKNDKIKLALYQSQLGKLEGTSAANAEKAAKAKIAAAKAQAIAQQKAKAAAADEARIENLALTHPHSWLVAQQAKTQAQMASYAARGNVTAYMGADGYYKDLTAAINRWPTQYSAQHDKLVSLRNSAQARANAFLAKGDFRDYMRANQEVTRRNQEITHVNQQASGASTADDPISRLATSLFNSGMLDKISYQMKFHSLNPAPTGKLSHKDMAALALNVTPSVLDAIYADNGAQLAGALKGDLFNGSGLMGQGSGAALALLAKATGIHGIYSGKKFAQGGWINEHVLGFGVKSGMPYSFGEGGRRERVLTDAQSQQGGNSMTNSLLVQLIDETRRNTETVAFYGQATSKSLHKPGIGIL